MLKEKLSEDLKAAMKSHDVTVVSVIRMLQAAIKNKEIAKKDTLTDEEIFKILQGEKKKHLDSIAQFEQGGRLDLVEKEKAEVKIIEGYLPAQMNEAALRQLIAAAVAQNPGADFGQVMKAVMAKAAGSADGAVVSQLVKKALTPKANDPAP